MPATDDDTLLPFSLPSICQKKVTAAFDGGLISSDGGVLLLAGADKRLGLIDTLAAIIPDHRDPALITHTMADILRARVFAIACGYPDADDLDDLRKDHRGRDACHHTPPAQIPAGGFPAPGSHLGCLTAKRWPGQGCVMRGLGSHRFCSTAIRRHVTVPFWPRRHSARRQRLVMLKRKSPSAAELVGTAW